MKSINNINNLGKIIKKAKDDYLSNKFTDNFAIKITEDRMITLNIHIYNTDYITIQHLYYMKNLHIIHESIMYMHIKKINDKIIMSATFSHVYEHHTEIIDILKGFINIIKPTHTILFEEDSMGIKDEQELTNFLTIKNIKIYKPCVFCVYQDHCPDVKNRLNILVGNKNTCPDLTMHYEGINIPEKLKNRISNKDSVKLNDDKYYNRPHHLLDDIMQNLVYLYLKNEKENKEL